MEKSAKRSEVQMLQEKLQSSRLEIDDLKIKLKMESQDKVYQLETQIKNLKDDVRKKDEEIRGLTNEQMQTINDNAKKQALME